MKHHNKCYRENLFAQKLTRIETILITVFKLFFFQILELHIVSVQSFLEYFAVARKIE